MEVGLIMPKERTDCHNIKIIQPDIVSLGTKIYIDGKIINNVAEIEYRVSAMDELPELKISVNGTKDIDINVPYIKLEINPLNVEDAFLIMRTELMKHGIIYDSFISSIYSVLKSKENGNCFICDENSAESLAKEILARIIGES